MLLFRVMDIGENITANGMYDNKNIARCEWKSDLWLLGTQHFSGNKGDPDEREDNKRKEMVYN